MTNDEKSDIHSFTSQAVLELGGRWQKNLVQALRSCGNPDDAVDAVQEAIRIVAGIHPAKRLDAPLKPMNEHELFLFLLRRAKWELSHIREKDNCLRFEGSTAREIEGLIRQAESDPLLSPRQREKRVRNLKRQLRLLADVPDRDHGVVVHRLDRKAVREEILRIVGEVFKSHHVGEKRVGAFIDAFFSDLSGEQRAQRWQMSVDNVHVSKTQLIRLLGAFRAKFAQSQILRDYYPWLRDAA